MTALFCDLIDSVRMSVRLDPEDLLRVLDLYRSSCEDIITHHGGFIARFVGDGILAYFGFPRADEDDAANAVRAGLDLVATISGLDVRPENPLQIRVGIGTGLVVVHDRSSSGNARTTEAVGRMPNLAARLQSVARPNSVVIADSTRRVTRGMFAYNDLGRMSLKGFSHPVQVWEATAPTTDVSRFRARLLGDPPPFVGRQSELDLLSERWREARSGEGRVVQIIGDPGIGKSRLTEALQVRLADVPHARVRWFCSPQYTDSALYAVIDQLEHAASIARQDPPTLKIEKLIRLVGESDGRDEMALAVYASLLSIPLGRPSPLDTMTPEKRKEVTIATLLAELTRLWAAGPVLMVVEDAHWVDATSLELLDLVVRQAAKYPTLLIVTARPEFKLRWKEIPYVSAISLGRLDPDSAEKLCAHVAGDALSADVLRQIVQRCDGVPLFAEELTKTVVESLDPTNDDTVYSAGDGAAAIPNSLHDSLVARLDRLGPARQIANIGAVLGRRFNYDLLAAVMEQPDRALRAALRQLIQSGLVSQVGTRPANSYLFKHALIRDAAYESLLRTDRQELHGRVAAVLMSKFPETVESEPEAIAYHLSQSGAEVEAVPYWEKAGQRAASRAAHSDATAHYSNALEIVRKKDESIERTQRELSLLIPLAISLSSSRGYAVDEVRDALTQARDICDRLGNVSALYPVLRGLCTFSIVRSDLVVAEELARRCMAIGEETRIVPYLIEADNALGFVLAGRGKLEAARIHLERAVLLYDENEHLGLVFPTEQDPRMAAGIQLAVTLYLLGDVIGARTTCEQSLTRARALNRPFDLVFALYYASLYHVLRKDYTTANGLSEEILNISNTHGFRLFILCGQLIRSLVMASRGNVADAITILEPTLAAFSAMGVRYLICFYVGQLADFYASVGRMDLARTTIDAAIRQAVDNDDLTFLSDLYRIRAEILARDPEPDWVMVERELYQAISIARSQRAEMLEREASARLSIIPRQLATTN
jgi:class 3 adenylate cyclase/tetratricopeptide (TPR) repeat protein